MITLLSTSEETAALDYARQWTGKGRGMGYARPLGVNRRCVLEVENSRASIEFSGAVCLGGGHGFAIPYPMTNRETA